MRSIGLMVVMLIVVMVAGCTNGPGFKVPAPYSENIILKSELVGELNNRCQTGDVEACSKGLAAAAEALASFVDGMNGVDPNGGVK